jgi:hypothetical protein
MTRLIFGVALPVVKQRHQAEIHVRPLMAMQQCRPWIISHEIDAGRLETTQHHDILHHARRRFAASTGQFETVPVQGMHTSLALRNFSR